MATFEEEKWLNAFRKDQADQDADREYATVWHLVSALSNICIAHPDLVINSLIGVLWDTNEAQKIKDAGVKTWSQYVRNEQNK